MVNGTALRSPIYIDPRIAVIKIVPESNVSFIEDSFERKRLPDFVGNVSG